MRSLSDKRVVLIENQQNLGLTKSLNVGLSAAKGKYIARMDSDDISLPERFQRQVEFMEENYDVIVSGTWFEKFGTEQCIRKPRIDDFEMYRCQLLFSNSPITLCHPSVMMRKSMLDEYHIRYDETIKKSQDYAMWVECSKHGRIAIFEEVLLRYRTHVDQISVSKRNEQIEGVRAVFERQMKEFGIDGISDVPTEKVSATVFYSELLDKIIERNKELNLFHEIVLKQYRTMFIVDQVRHMVLKERFLLISKGKLRKYVFLYYVERLKYERGNKRQTL